MEDTLISAGLTELQAQTYLYLLKKGPSFPNQLTAKLNITRTNAYKVLESLEKLDLVTRKTKDKKIIFTAEDPIALASLVAEKRNNIIALEKSVNNAMQQLRRSYARGQTSTRVHTGRGKEAIIWEYQQQAQLKQPIRFVATRAERPFLGFEDIHGVRVLQGELSPGRYGITPDAPEAPINPELDRATKLTRTWIDEKDYTAPVEWSVSGDNLIIQIFDGEGRTIAIQDSLVAESFRQLWQLLDRALRKSDDYRLLPVRARRVI